MNLDVDVDVEVCRVSCVVCPPPPCPYTDPSPSASAIAATPRSSTAATLPPGSLSFYVSLSAFFDIMIHTRALHYTPMHLTRGFID